jgi:dTDP-4-dehydrorhamnose reductase
MKIVILGPSGQLGSDVARAAATAWPDAELVPLGRDRLDLAAAGALVPAADAIGGDIWINCAGYTRTDAAEDDAGRAMRVNAHAVRELGDACGRIGARLYHVSTDYVFGGDRARREPYREGDAPCPINVYGASKALGETLLSGCAANATVLRVASLFGVAGVSGQGGNFVETMLRMARAGTVLRVVDDQTMSPTSTADAAAALMRLIAADAPAGTYHLVNTGAATWHGFAAAILDLAGVAARLVPVASAALALPAERPAYSVLDTAKLAGAVGALPHWRDALARYLRAKGHRVRL